MSNSQVIRQRDMRVSLVAWLRSSPVADDIIERARRLELDEYDGVRS